MVFLYQVTQFGILLFQVLVCHLAHSLIAHRIGQLVLGSHLADKGFVGFLAALVALHVFLNLGVETVDGLHRTMTGHLGNMPTETALEGLTHLAIGQ